MKAKIKFNPPAKFEGKEYKELDFSELGDWTSLQYAQVESRYRKMFPEAGSSGKVVEAQPEFAWFIGNEVTKLPIEFFQQLKPKYIKAISVILARFFFTTADDYAEMVEMDLEEE